jgi:hypothetical protein
MGIMVRTKNGCCYPLNILPLLPTIIMGDDGFYMIFQMGRRRIFLQRKRRRKKCMMKNLIK